MNNTTMRPGAGRALFAAVAGTLIEWYDYALYGTAAGLIIGPLFFAGMDSGASLAAFATFAVGFVARPLGGVLVGHLGDRYGRRPAMLLTVILMGVATVGIGLLPTYAAIGVAAPVFLVLLRLLQGMGAGAELAGAMTLVAEFAPPRRRGLMTSLVLAAPPAGIVLATGAFLWAASLGDQVLLDWAWRLPFLASAVLFALAIFIRVKLEESPEYLAALHAAKERGERRRVPVVALVREHWRAVVVGFFAITGHNALNYILAVFSLSFMTSPAVGMDRGSALTAVIIGSVCGVLATPLGGLAADRFGAHKVLAFGSLLGAVGAFPLFSVLSSGSAMAATAAISVGYGVVIACTSGSQGAYLAGLFPAAERFSGIALAREANGAIVAGFTPLIAATLITAAGGQTWAAALFLMACCVISVVGVLLGKPGRYTS
ncbi:MFS transporter [Kocuria sp. WRN011]|uniref:MFS transporter n=1 Tax=Kocuria sp. WRN011 TaxID=2029858 RepID=UPI0020B10742|nr:MFS transporter [Kocuria sp. WRN011]